MSNQVIKKRYEAEGDDCQTDEFLKPIIVDPDGRIQGIWTLKTKLNFANPRNKCTLRAVI